MQTGKKQPSLFNTNDVINDTITNTLVTPFFNSSNNFTKQLTTVILMSSIDEIKKLLTDLFTYIRKNYKNILYYLKPSTIYILICNFFRNKNLPIQYAFEKQYANEKIIEITITTKFLDNIINYINQNLSTCELCYDDEYKINIINRNEIEYEKNIKYFKINYEDLIIESCNKLKIKTNLQNNIISHEIIEEFINPDNVKSFIDLVPYKSDLYNYIKINAEYIKTRMYMDNYIPGWTKPDRSLTNSASNEFAIIVFNILKPYCKNIIFEEFYYEFMIFYKYNLLIGRYGKPSTLLKKSYVTVKLNKQKLISQSKEMYIFTMDDTTACSEFQNMNVYQFPINFQKKYDEFWDFFFDQKNDSLSSASDIQLKIQKNFRCFFTNLYNP